MDVTPEQLEALNIVAEKAGNARAEVIRQALDSYLAIHREPLTSYFGMWANNPATQDVQGFIDEVREEWDR